MEAAQDEPFTELAMLLGRAFYEDMEIIVLDKLVLLRQPLTDRELADVLLLSERQVRKALVPLLRDRLVGKLTVKLADVDVTTATAAEYREHQRALGEQTSYAVDLATVPDYAKYKLHMLRARAAANGRGSGGDGDGDGAPVWRCEPCDLSFSEADAWALFDRDRQVFTCERCGLPVNAVAVERAADVDESVLDERRRALEKLFAPLLVALGRCDKALEEGRDPPPLLRVAANAAEELAAGAAGGGAVAREAGARALPRAGAKGAPADGLPSLTVEMNVSIAPVAALSASAKAAQSTLFWQADAADVARKRTREQEEAAEAEAAEAERAARDDAWAQELRANQERLQRERNRALGAVPLAQPAPAPVQPAAAAAADADDDWEEEAEEAEEALVTVQGVQKRLSEVTEDDQERMSSDEYRRWHELSTA